MNLNPVFKYILIIRLICDISFAQNSTMNPYFPLPHRFGFNYSVIDNHREILYTIDEEHLETILYNVRSGKQFKTIKARVIPSAKYHLWFISGIHESFIYNYENRDTLYKTAKVEYVSTSPNDEYTLAVNEMGFYFIENKTIISKEIIAKHNFSRLYDYTNGSETIRCLWATNSKYCAVTWIDESNFNFLLLDTEKNEVIECAKTIHFPTRDKHYSHPMKHFTFSRNNDYFAYINYNRELIIININNKDQKYIYTEKNKNTIINPVPQSIKFNSNNDSLLLNFEHKSVFAFWNNKKRVKSGIFDHKEGWYLISGITDNLWLSKENKLAVFNRQNNSIEIPPYLKNKSINEVEIDENNFIYIYFIPKKGKVKSSELLIVDQKKPNTPFFQLDQETTFNSHFILSANNHEKIIASNESGNTAYEINLNSFNISDLTHTNTNNIKTVLKYHSSNPYRQIFIQNDPSINLQNKNANANIFFNGNLLHSIVIDSVDNLEKEKYILSDNGDLMCRIKDNLWIIYDLKNNKKIKYIKNFDLYSFYIDQHNSIICNNNKNLLVSNKEYVGKLWSISINEGNIVEIDSVYNYLKGLRSDEIILSKKNKIVKYNLTTNKQAEIYKNQVYCENIDFLKGDLSLLISERNLDKKPSDEYNLIYYDILKSKIKSSVKFDYLFGDNKLILCDSLIATNGYEYNITFYSIASGEKTNLYILNPETFAFVNKNNYYFGSNKFIKNIFFSTSGAKSYSFEQFDLKFNRPDKVLSSLGIIDNRLINIMHSAYLKRLKKMNFTEDMLKEDFHLPEIKIKNFEYLPSIQETDELELDIDINDTKYKLDRINIFINDVPVYGSAGIDLRKENTQSLEKKISLQLSEGQNKIQVSVLNQAGAESYKETAYVTYKPKQSKKPDLYLVTIGDSKYADSRFDLTYAAKDAEDIKKTFEGNASYGIVFTYSYTNENVTRENILKLKNELKKAKRDDVVIITVAGHGVLDKNLDYYLATYDMDFNNPSGKGIPYEELESLVDGIAPLKKVIFLDACHSGEVDKEEVEQLAVNTTGSGNVKFRAAGAGIQKKNLGLKTTSELMSELFTDLRKGTGATVISSAGGAEYAMESDQWKNGLFTYCLLHGLKDKAADANGDGQIMLSELQNYLRREVTNLSNGAQQPTSRIENLTMDFRVW